MDQSLRACEGVSVGCIFQGPSAVVDLHEPSCPFFLQERRFVQVQQALSAQIEGSFGQLSQQLTQQQKRLQNLELNVRIVSLRLGLNLPSCDPDQNQRASLSSSDPVNVSDRCLGQNGTDDQDKGIKEEEEEEEMSDEEKEKKRSSLLTGIQSNIEELPRRDKQVISSLLYSILRLGFGGGN